MEKDAELERVRRSLNEGKVPMMVDPDARESLRRLLLDDESLRGVGYSEFIRRAVEQHVQRREE